MHRIKADLCVMKVALIILVKAVAIACAVWCPGMLILGWLVLMLVTAGGDGWSPFVYPEQQLRLAFGVGSIAGCFSGLVMWVIVLRSWSQIATEKGLSFREFAMLSKDERNEILDAAKASSEKR